MLKKFQNEQYYIYVNSNGESPYYKILKTFCQFQYVNGSVSFMFNQGCEVSNDHWEVSFRILNLRLDH